MSNSVPNVNGKAGQMMDWAKWISQVAVAPLLGLSLWAFWEHETRLDELKLGQQSRYTAEDGVKQQIETVKLANVVLLIEERLAEHIAGTLPASSLVTREQFTEAYIETDRRLSRLEK